MRKQALNWLLLGLVKLGLNEEYFALAARNFDDFLGCMRVRLTTGVFLEHTQEQMYSNGEKM